MHASQAGLDVLLLLVQDALTKTVPIWAAVLNRAIAQLRSYHDGNRLIADSNRLLSTYPAQAELVHKRHVSQMQYNTRVSNRSVMSGKKRIVNKLVHAMDTNSGILPCICQPGSPRMRRYR